MMDKEMALGWCNDLLVLLKYGLSIVFFEYRAVFPLLFHDRFPVAVVEMCRDMNLSARAAAGCVRTTEGVVSWHNFKRDALLPKFPGLHLDVCAVRIRVWNELIAYTLENIESRATELLTDVKMYLLLSGVASDRFEECKSLQEQLALCLENEWKLRGYCCDEAWCSVLEYCFYLLCREYGDSVLEYCYPRRAAA